MRAGVSLTGQHQHISYNSSAFQEVSVELTSFVLLPRISHVIVCACGTPASLRPSGPGLTFISSFVNSFPHCRPLLLSFHLPSLLSDMLVSLLGASSLIGFASAACLQIRQSSGATLPTPANDPFYFPTNYTSLNNGAVIGKAAFGNHFFCSKCTDILRLASRSVSTTVAPILSLVSNVTVATYQVSCPCFSQCLIDLHLHHWLVRPYIWAFRRASNRSSNSMGSDA